MGGNCSTHKNLRVSEHSWEDGAYKIDCTKVGTELNWLGIGAE